MFAGLKIECSIQCLQLLFIVKPVLKNVMCELL